MSSITETRDSDATGDAVLVGGGFEPPSPRMRRFVTAIGHFLRDHMLGLSIGGLLLVLIGAPLVFLMRMSVATGGRPTDPGGYTLDNFARIFQNPTTATATWNTVVYAVGVTVLSLSIAALFAWLIERTDLPFRNLAWVIMLAPLAIPGFLSAMAYILLFAENQGLVNIVARQLLSAFGIGLEDGPFNIYSMWGMIFVEGLKGTTTLFLMIVGAFRLMDPSLEEAAVMSGKGRVETLRRVTLPLMKPVLVGALIYAFVNNLQDFDTPLVIGLSAGIYVLPTLIYFTAYVSPRPNWGNAAAYASLFVVLMFVLSAWYYRVVIRVSGKFTTVSGKAYRPDRLQLGRWRKWAFAGFACFGLLSVVLPVLVLIWTSLLPGGFEIPSAAAWDKVNLDNYMEIGTARIFTALRNTVVLSVVAAFVTMAFALLVSWAVIRIRVRGRGFMDSMAFVPNAIPSVALGLALILFFLHPAMRWIPIYGTLGLLVLAFAVHYLAYASRITNGAVSQMGAELEEASWVAGVSKLRTLARVTLPILVPTFIAGSVWVFAKVFRNLTLPLMLARGPDTTTISIIVYEQWNEFGNPGVAAALGVSMIVLLAVAAFAARRLVSKGFTE